MSDRFSRPARDHVRVGYHTSPFVMDVMRVTRLDNPDQHPTAPAFEIEVAHTLTYRPVLLTRAHVLQLRTFFDER